MNTLIHLVQDNKYSLNKFDNQLTLALTLSCDEQLEVYLTKADQGELQMQLLYYISACKKPNQLSEYTSSAAPT